MAIMDRVRRGEHDVSGEPATAAKDLLRESPLRRTAGASRPCSSCATPSTTLRQRAHLRPACPQPELWTHAVRAAGRLDAGDACTLPVTPAVRTSGRVRVPAPVPVREPVPGQTARSPTRCSPAGATQTVQPRPVQPAPRAARTPVLAGAPREPPSRAQRRATAPRPRSPHRRAGRLRAVRRDRAGRRRGPAAPHRLRLAPAARLAAGWCAVDPGGTTCRRPRCRLPGYLLLAFFGALTLVVMAACLRLGACSRLAYLLGQRVAVGMVMAGLGVRSGALVGAGIRPGSRDDPGAGQPDGALGVRRLVGGGDVRRWARPCSSGCCSAADPTGLPALTAPWS